jgi:hypothetical protein
MNLDMVRHLADITKAVGVWHTPRMPTRHAHALSLHVSGPCQSQARTVEREILVAVRRRNDYGDAGDAKKLGKISKHKGGESLAYGSSCYERQLDMLMPYLEMDVGR